MRFSDITDGARDIYHDAGNYMTGLLTPTLRLGVTGLARSGKTVFITTLVRNIVTGGRLPFFTPAQEGRIKRAYLEPQPDDDVPRFSYEDHLALLRGDPPLWPVSTNMVSQLRVTIEYESRSLMRRALGTNMLHVDIVDYPGEWLLDLPLIDMRYEQWASDALTLARHPIRKEHARPFLDFLDDLQRGIRAGQSIESEPYGSAERRGEPAKELLGDNPDANNVEAGKHQDAEQIARRGAKLFTDYLNAARADDHALSVAGPGRLLMPGDLEGSPLLTFFPMDPVAPSTTQAVAAPSSSETISSLNASSLAAEQAMQASAAVQVMQDLPRLLRRRFESYKSHVVKPFFRDHFAKLDRQIVLVDALAALNAGPTALVELQGALEKILHCFKPGANSWLSAILFRRIDRLLFAATKADHLHHTSHDRLEAVLSHLTDRAMQRATLSGAQVKVMAMAALRTTVEVDVRQDGEDLACIQGTPLPGERLGDQVFDGKTKIAIFPGDLPPDAALTITRGRDVGVDAGAGEGEGADADGNGEQAARAGIDDAASKRVNDHPAAADVDFDDHNVRFIRFRPPRLDQGGYGGDTTLPHIRLDRALEFLIGDRLQ